ncbi:MAG: CaiB/BaiF CoA transferase family protein [Acidimicrobiales bacterium]
MTGSRALPLEGVTVLDLGHIYQGPYAGFLLATAGARVIKVEPLRGEGLRVRGANMPFAMLNSCKESVSIDLKHPDGLAAFHQLAAKVDVVLVNFAPGVPEKLGIGFEQLIEANPRLIYAHGSGFGVRELDGSLTETSVPAMDITIQAHVGHMEINGFPENPPVKSGAANIDFLGGTHLYGAITTALFERERTGVGRSVEIRMADAAYFPLATALGPWHRTGKITRDGNYQPGRGLAPYNVYKCADGYVALIAASNRHWRSVLSVVGREDLLADERFKDFGDRAKNIHEVDEIVESWTSTRPKAEVAGALQAAHVPTAAVRVIDEVVHDESQFERGGMHWVDHPELGRLPLPHSPMRWHGSPQIELDPSPRLGAHNRLVFGELAGMDDATLDALTADGAIGSPAVG